MINVRPPIALDHGPMARLLNEIIAPGDTTALVRPVAQTDIAEWMAFAPDQSAWHVAVDESETVVGFQWIEPDASLPSEAANIATFVQVGRTGLGIGSKLFNATRQAAKELGYTWINANIRADNEGGLIYYQSRGFQDYGTIKDHRMDDGRLVDKCLKRFDL
ncbi:MAG: GNAT family N-acetyltransferase [Pseudomonadota bacterium]